RRTNDSRADRLRGWVIGRRARQIVEPAHSTPGDELAADRAQAGGARGAAKHSRFLFSHELSAPGYNRTVHRIRLRRGGGAGAVAVDVPLVAAAGRGDAATRAGVATGFFVAAVRRDRIRSHAGAGRAARREAAGAGSRSVK